MRAALRGSFVDYVIFTGMTERYPLWFEREVFDSIYMDEHRYTFWMPEDERPYNYHDMVLVETDSIFLRKENGEVFCTSKYVFENLYDIFYYDGYTNSGVAAFGEDCIDYVECSPGVLSKEYPDWFYEYFTESIHFPPDNESIFIYSKDKKIFKSDNPNLDILKLDSTQCQVSITEHAVFLRNRFGEIRATSLMGFHKHYDTRPIPLNKVI